MKKTLIMSSAVILMVISLTVGFSFAGNGRGNKTGICDKIGICNKTGICDKIGDPVCDICAGEPFEYTGAVEDSTIPGQGMVLTTDEGKIITIYGIGPVRYWESQDEERPVVGDLITVNGYTVDYNGVDRNIATSVLVGGVGGVTVELRDPETCAPLWRQYNRLRR